MVEEKILLKLQTKLLKKLDNMLTRDRKVRKKRIPGLWIQRINAGCRLHGIKYSMFINGLKKIKP